MEFYKKRRRDLLRDWTRDREELLNRIAVIFNEVTLSAEMTEVKQQYREQQEEICKQLYNQVNIYIYISKVLSLPWKSLLVPIFSLLLNSLENV